MVWLLPVGALALVLEGAEPVVPVTNLGPDPALSVLPHLPAGPVQLFPNTQTAGREGSRTPEEMNYHLGRQARELAEPEQALLLQGYLAHLSGTELPLARAEELWSSRTADPILQAREDGVVGLILDHRSISLESLERMESWLVVRVGEALAVSADWSVYRLEPLESP